MNVSLTALSENVSSSLSRSLAVLSNTIIASASIAILLRNTSGNCISGPSLYSMCPKNIPARISNNTSGMRSLFPTHEHTTPTNSSTAIAVVMISASCIVYCLFSRIYKLSSH